MLLVIWKPEIHGRTDEIRRANITMPFKSKLISYADILDNDSIQTGNVNCLHFKNKKIYGYNNDVYGFSKMLNHNTIKLAGSNNIIIGSGSVVTKNLSKQGIYFGNPAEEYVKY